MNDQSAAYVDLPRTAYLNHTLRRARTAAEQRSHRYVTLEHLLLALLDDPDAAKLLQAAGADVAVIHSAVSDAVNNRMASLAATERRPPGFSSKFDSLFVSASEDAVGAGRREVDGALTLIAVAKDAESKASAILTANGFSPQAALDLISPPEPQQPRLAQPNGASQHQPHPAARVGAPVRNAVQTQNQKTAGSAPRSPAHLQPAEPAAEEESMEDMLASVRDILKDEEQKDQQPLAMDLAPVQRPQKTRTAQPVKLPPHAAASATSGFAESLAPTFDIEKTPRPEKRPAQPRPRGKAGNLTLLPKLLDHVPRKAKAGVPRTIKVPLSKEDAALLFGGPQRRGQPQKPAGAEAVCRAVTLHLSSPDEGFFIEGLAPETQWILDRPPPGEEAFGAWAWTALPNGGGSCTLRLTLSARDIDANGAASDINLPEQAIKVRVSGNFWRGAGRFLGRTLLFLAGSGLGVAAYHALKIAGKLPH